MLQYEVMSLVSHLIFLSSHPQLALENCASSLSQVYVRRIHFSPCPSTVQPLGTLFFCILAADGSCTHAHTNTYMYIYIYPIFVHVPFWLCKWSGKLTKHPPHKKPLKQHLGWHKVGGRLWQQQQTNLRCHLPPPPFRLLRPRCLIWAPTDVYVVQILCWERKLIPCSKTER